MSKQTAVQLLVESMTTSDVSFYQKEIAIALQMEREQIIDVAMYHKDSTVEIDCINSYIAKNYGGKDE
jgi:hypothetical protein